MPWRFESCLVSRAVTEGCTQSGPVERCGVKTDAPARAGKFLSIVILVFATFIVCTGASGGANTNDLRLHRGSIPRKRWPT